MRLRPGITLLILAVSAIVVWGVVTTVGTQVAGGREAFLAWRTEHFRALLLIWAGGVVAVTVPALLVAGRRMQRWAEQQDEAVVKARGVGRLAVRALQGDAGAVERLLGLLDDPQPAVRYQSARALAFLDDAAVEKELFRKVRYWDVTHKLGVVDVLRRTMDLRAVKLLRLLSRDRNPMVARKATTALTIVQSRSGNIDDVIARRRRQAKARARAQGKAQKETQGKTQTEAQGKAQTTGRDDTRRD